MDLPQLNINRYAHIKRRQELTYPLIKLFLLCDTSTAPNPTIETPNNPVNNVLEVFVLVFTFLFFLTSFLTKFHLMIILLFMELILFFLLKNHLKNAENLFSF